MATAAHIPSAALNEAFKKELFGKEVEGWLGRATPADRERFERVFQSIRSISEAKKTPDAHANFVQNTLEKIRQRSSSAAAGPNARTPQLARGSPAAVCNGWSYTATRAAFERPETRTAILTLQEQATAQQGQQQQAEVEADRPQSAPGAGAAATIGRDRDRELSSFQQAADRRRALSFGNTAGPGPSSASAVAVAAAASVASTGRDASSGFVAISPHVTRYQETFNLRSCYPEIYDQALRDTKIEPQPNGTFISEWGNSLKSGSDEAAKLYMRTTYNTTNDEVVKLKTDADAVREREFFKWMQRQKTFYGDLLSKAKTKDLDAVLAVASDEQKREILEAMRMTHAVADTCFDRTRSHSQTIHYDMRRTEDEKTEALRKSLVKARTMGQPIARRGAARRPATAELKPSTLNLTMSEDGTDGAAGRVVPRALKPSRRPATAGAALSRVPAVPPPQRTELDKSETFRSKIPLSWPTGVTGPHVSTYVETFGGAKIGAGHARPNSALYRVEAVRPPDATCPFGAVNPYTAVVPQRASYPVPEVFTATGTVGFPQPKGSTSYRSDYYHRDPADVAAQLRAATALVENGRKLLDRGTIPMGPRTGVNVLPSSMWISETKESFVPHDVDPREPRERAAVMRSLFTAPTGTTGKMTLSRPGARHT